MNLQYKVLLFFTNNMIVNFFPVIVSNQTSYPPVDCLYPKRFLYHEYGIGILNNMIFFLLRFFSQASCTRFAKFEVCKKTSFTELSKFGPFGAGSSKMAVLAEFMPLR